MSIPFKYGQIVSGKDFCGRQVLIGQILEYVKSGQNIVVLGERRIGKSSLVHEGLRRWKAGRFLYVDLMGIKSDDALCRRILRNIVTFQRGAGWLNRVLKALAHLKPSISADPVTGLPTVSFDTSVQMSARSVPEVLELVESVKGKKPLAVVLDEFQDVLNVEDARETLALLRGKIQFQSDIPYVFVGSIRHKMDAIFSDHDSPFFKSAIPITVSSLPDEEFAAFIRKKFGSGDRKVENDLLERVFEISKRVPGDVQQLCEALWEVSQKGEPLGDKNLRHALELIFSREQKSYEGHLTLLTDLQQRCLKTLARVGGENIFSKAFMGAGGFTNASSVRRAVKRLRDLGILYKDAEGYSFINPFFRAWLLTL